MTWLTFEYDTYVHFYDLVLNNAQGFLQCFDTFGWVTERASGPYRLYIHTGYITCTLYVTCTTIS